MRNILKIAALSALVTSQAGAETPSDIPDLKAGDMIHFCSKGDLESGVAIGLAQGFNTELKNSLIAEPVEVSAAKKSEAEKTFARALEHISDQRLESLGARITALKAIKIEQEPTAALVDGMAKEVDITHDLQDMQDAINTLVTTDKNKVMQVKPVAVSENTVRRTDTTAAFGTLSEKGITCPAEVLDYTVERRGFPSTSEAAAIDFKQFIAGREQPAENIKAPAAPNDAKTPAPTEAVEEKLDLSAQYIDTLVGILKDHERLQKDAERAIKEYKAYIDSI